MRCKWYFRNEISEDFSHTPSFRKESTWEPPAGHLALELFLSEVERELFDKLPGILKRKNMSKEWLAMRSLANDRSSIIKHADKGS